jgi:hypothetical protein
VFDFAEVAFQCSDPRLPYVDIHIEDQGWIDVTMPHELGSATTLAKLVPESSYQYSVIIWKQC